MIYLHGDIPAHSLKNVEHRNIDHSLWTVQERWVILVREGQRAKLVPVHRAARLRSHGQNSLTRIKAGLCGTYDAQENAGAGLLLRNRVVRVDGGAL